MAKLELTELQELVLVTLSFYAPMNFSQILFDMDMGVLKSYPDFDRDQMFVILAELEKMGVIKKAGIGNDATWIRIHKKRPFWKKIFNFF